MILILSTKAVHLKSIFNYVQTLWTQYTSKGKKHHLSSRWNIRLSRSDGQLLVSYGSDKCLPREQEKIVWHHHALPSPIPYLLMKADSRCSLDYIPVPTWCELISDTIPMANILNLSAWPKCSVVRTSVRQVGAASTPPQKWFYISTRLANFTTELRNHPVKVDKIEILCALVTVHWYGELVIQQIQVFRFFIHGLGAVMALPDVVCTGRFFSKNNAIFHWTEHLTLSKSLARQVLCTFRNTRTRTHSILTFARFRLVPVAPDSLAV